MFRKMAIALAAASVFTAPVLAQNETLSGGSNTSKNPPTTSAPQTDNASKAEKSETTTDKSAENAGKSEKTGKRHRRVARHHRHGTKSAKLMGKGHHAKYAKYEGRRGHGRTTSRTHAYGRGSKHMLSKKPSVD